MVKSYKSVIKAIEAAPEDVQWYYTPIVNLIADYAYGVPLAYAFSQLERGQRNALYCGMRKIHGVHSDIAWKAIRSEHLTRKLYRERFKDVLAKNIPHSMIEDIEIAEKTRDTYMHGRNPNDADMRTAIVAVIHYSEGMNRLCELAHGFRPYGNLKGFAGAGTSLNVDTSRLVAKGLGFSLG